MVISALILSDIVALFHHIPRVFDFDNVIMSFTCVSGCLLSFVDFVRCGTAC